MKKDKEWLKEDINSELIVYSGNPNMGSYDYGRVSGLNYALKLINQLEEPEQEKPVIPQFVSDWIEDKKSWSAFDVFYDIDEQDIESNKISDWLYDNDDDENAKREIVLLQALRSGYTVEKEKLYRVKLPNNFYLYKYSAFDKRKTSYIEDKYLASVDKSARFTEQEIKNIDERYWAFAEEVTK